MFITITRTGLHRIGVGLSVFAVLTAVFILFPRENAEPTAAEQAVSASVSDWGLSFQTEGQPPVAMSPPRNCGSTTRFTSVTRAERPST